ncbi:MAG: transcriptional regulator [Phycisphaeraceae bacterium]|nr:transcriptional regulator [Phycisphaeraceae bacterium]
MDELDDVFKALADPTRRAILDLLRERPRRTTELVEAFPRLSRFGVMKHLDVLKGCGLVIAKRQGREVINRLNAVPLRQVYERWVSRFEGAWAHELLQIRELAEEEGTGA